MRSSIPSALGRRHDGDHLSPYLSYRHCCRRVHCARGVFVSRGIGGAIVAVKHVGTTWLVDERVSIVAVYSPDTDRWKLLVLGVEDSNQYDSAEDVFEAGLPAAEETAQILADIAALQARLNELGISEE